MNATKYLSVPKLIATAQLYAHNATVQPVIQQKMKQYGFSAQRLQEGKVLVEQLKMLYGQQNEKYSKKLNLFSHIQSHELQTRQALADHVSIVRHVFRKDPDTLSQFNLKQMSRKVEEWTLQAEFFYAKAAAHVAQLSAYGLAQEQIEQARAMVEAVATARHAHIQSKGEAEEATRVRNQQLRALKAWMKDFRAVARLALQDNPQLLEALGMHSKSQKV